MADLTVNIKASMLTPQDEPERGWCPVCNVSSVFFWWMTLEIGSALTLLKAGACVDCGEEIAE